MYTSRTTHVPTSSSGVLSEGDDPCIVGVGVSVGMGKAVDGGDPEIQKHP